MILFPEEIEARAKEVEATGSPQAAAIARLMAKLLPAYGEWLGEELQRKSDVDTIMHATAGGAAAIMNSTVVNLVGAANGGLQGAPTALIEDGITDMERRIARWLSEYRAAIPKIMATSGVTKN